MYELIEQLRSICKYIAKSRRFWFIFSLISFQFYFCYCL